MMFTKNSARIKPQNKTLECTRLKDVYKFDDMFKLNDFINRVGASIVLRETNTQLHVTKN